MTVDCLSARAAALLGSALMLAACGAEKEQAADTSASPPAVSAPLAETPRDTAPPPAAAAVPTPAAAPARTVATTPAPTPPTPPPGTSGLAAYANRFPFDKVGGIAWNDHPAVKAGIAATVKDAKARKAIETLEGPAAPIEMRGGKLMAWACEAHNCGAHQWAVHIDPKSGATDVCYFDEAASATQSRWFLAGGKDERRAGNCQ